MGDDIIGYIINDLTSGNGDLPFSETIVSSASTYNSTVWSDIDGVMRSAVLPIGGALLSIFMLIELVAIIQRMEGTSGITGVNIPANIMIRWGIITFLYARSGKILLGIQSVMATIATNIGSATTVNPSVGANVIAALESMGLVDKVICYIILVNVWFVYAALRLILRAFVIYRVASIYLLTLFAPIPLATLPSPDFKHTAFNYLKSYAAACMSGAVIMGAFKIYNLLASSTLGGESVLFSAGTATIGEFCGGMLKLMVFYGILVSMVLNSGKISKSILNAT